MLVGFVDEDLGLVVGFVFVVMFFVDEFWMRVIGIVESLCDNFVVFIVFVFFNVI